MVNKGQCFESPHASPSQHTVGCLIDRYLREVKHTSATLSQCNRLQNQFGSIPLSQLSPATVSKYRDVRLETASVATVIRELAVLKRVINVAVREWGWVKQNPIAGVSNPKGPNKRVRWITAEERIALQEKVPPWLNDIIVFALETGMRRGEILALDWKDVHLDQAYLVVSKSKNGDMRGIPLSSVALTLLRSMPLRSGFVFLKEGVRISADALEYAFRQACERAGIEDLHFHDLRHSFCTKLIRKGVDLYRVQILAGHKSPAMTQRYAHHSMDSLRSAIKCLE